MARLALYLTLALTAIFQEEAAPLAGGLAAHHGHGDLVLVALAVAVGSWGGDLVLYGIGRRGERWVRRPRLIKAFAFIGRHPRAAPLAIRFAYGLRFTLPIACGAAGLPFPSYAAWAGVSAAAWSAIFSLVGWSAGELAIRRFRDLGHYEVPFIVGVLVAGSAVFLLAYVRGRHHDVSAADSAADA